ncbi:unnamed protein product [Pedinophyceae sp. YPF-701]|nr:unnamed protein product [Pedinophyceae sp. YPF-701]
MISACARLPASACARPPGRLPCRRVDLRVRVHGQPGGAGNAERAATGTRGCRPGAACSAPGGGVSFADGATNGNRRHRRATAGSANACAAAGEVGRRDRQGGCGAGVSISVCAFAARQPAGDAERTAAGTPSVRMPSPARRTRRARPQGVLLS